MDISRIADIGTINQVSQTRPADHRTENKTSSLASEHTDKFVKSEAAFSPAYTKKSAQKQNSDNNMTQRENSDSTVDKVDAETAKGSLGARMTKGISHIIRAMLVKQGEVLSGNVPSIGAKMYAEELLDQLRALYGNTPAEENTPEFWQPDETAARLLMFFDAVSVEDGDKHSMLESSFLSAFTETEQLFGGRGHLPLESYETKQLVLESYFKGAA